QVLAEPARLPDLKLVSLTDEGDLAGDARKGLERFRQDDPAFRIHLQRLACPQQRDRIRIVPRRVRPVIAKQTVDLLQQLVSATVQRFAIQRRMDIQPLESIARQHRTERGWY